MFVVPTFVTTMNGVKPAARSSATVFASDSGSKRSRESTPTARTFFAGPARGKDRALWMVKTCTEMLGSWRPALPMTIKLEGDIHELSVVDKQKGFLEALQTCLSDLGGPPVDATVKGSVTVQRG